MRRKPIQIVVAVLALAVVAAFSLKLGGGSLEPTAPPGPTMHSLEDIYKAVSTPSQPVLGTFAFSAFLRVDGIPGESTDQVHPGWIEVLSFQWGVGRGGTAWPSKDPFYITKAIDKASPQLFQACCSGQHIPSVVLDLCPKTNPSQTFMEYRMSDVMVSSYEPLTTPQLADRPIEQVSLNYAKMELTYTAADANQVYTGWDFVTNTPTNPTLP